MLHKCLFFQRICNDAHIKKNHIAELNINIEETLLTQYALYEVKAGFKRIFYHKNDTAVLVAGLFQSQNRHTSELNEFCMKLGIADSKKYMYIYVVASKIDAFCSCIPVVHMLR